jgi:hypothetical protein
MWQTWRFSQPLKMQILLLTMILIQIRSKFEMPTNRKLVSLKKMHNFCSG